MKYTILLIILMQFTSCCKDKMNSTTSTDVIIITPPANPNPNQITDLTDVSFSDEKNGIIVGSYGYLAKTTDGGTTWVKQNVGFDYSFMAAFMLNISNYFTARVGIYKTNNSGSIFSECANLSTFSNSIFGIHFFNTNEGLIIKGKTILKSKDGGVSWQIKSEEAEFLSQLEFKSTSIGYASGGITYDGQSRGEIFKTHDGGETWSKILNSNSQIMAMSFINDKQGFYTTFFKEIYKTNDGGVTWSMISSITELPTSIRFVDETTGYISSLKGKLFKTIDGGKTWTIIYNKTDFTITKITSINKIVFAVGNNGLVLKIN
jgi:photosystem II stability/assembly factor-like uncharacterized protein